MPPPNMALPHFEFDNQLEPPPSFQQPSAHRYDRNSERRRHTRISKHGRPSSGRCAEGRNERAITTITATSHPATPTPTKSGAGAQSCTKDSHHTLHTPSSIKVTSSLGKPDPHPATSQSRRTSTATWTTAMTTNSATTTAGAVPAADAAACAPRSSFFDPWNSSSTGHQRAENRLGGSTSWRESRNAKLGEQFRGGLSGGIRRVADSVGAGSADFGTDGRKLNGGWEKGAKGLATSGQKSLVEVWGASKGMKGGSCKKMVVQKKGPHCEAVGAESGNREYYLQTLTPSADPNAIPEAFSNPPKSQQEMHKQIFAGLCFYINGSTAPLVSDLKLKQLLAERGGKTSLGLGRRSVTHVILGAAANQGGAGGGLSATKIQKEIARVGGKGIKFVGVEWVLTSIRLNYRQPEPRFSSLKLAPKGQNSVYGMLRRSPSSTSNTK